MVRATSVAAPERRTPRAQAQGVEFADRCRVLLCPLRRPSALAEPSVELHAQPRQPAVSGFGENSTARPRRQRQIACTPSSTTVRRTRRRPPGRDVLDRLGEERPVVGLGDVAQVRHRRARWSAASSGWSPGQRLARRTTSSPAPRRSGPAGSAADAARRCRRVRPGRCSTRYAVAAHRGRAASAPSTIPRVLAGRGRRCERHRRRTSANSVRLRDQPRRRPRHGALLGADAGSTARRRPCRRPAPTRRHAGADPAQADHAERGAGQVACRPCDCHGGSGVGISWATPGVPAAGPGRGSAPRSSSAGRRRPTSRSHRRVDLVRRRQAAQVDRGVAPARWSPRRREVGQPAEQRAGVSGVRSRITHHDRGARRGRRRSDVLDGSTWCRAPATTVDAVEHATSRRSDVADALVVVEARSRSARPAPPPERRVEPLRNARRPAGASSLGRADSKIGRARSAAGQASSSAATFLVRLGSTWTPGPMVVETVTFLM